MMDKEKVIQTARDAGFGNYAYEAADIFERFATAIRSATKEEDAKICDIEAVFAGSCGKKDASAVNCASAIRASK